jgi:DNA-binding transcriptional LysR family regulator
MPLDLESLATLEAVVAEGGIARAAQRLHKVPSAVSYQVSKLEQQLGTQLLNREGYRVKLTPAGEILLSEGRNLLGRAREIEALAKQFREGWEARLQVIVDGIVPLDAVLAALKDLAGQGAPTRVQVKVEFLRGVQLRFEKDEADLMIVKDFKDSDSLVKEPLAEIECVLCVASSHPLARLKKAPLPELQQHTEVTVQDSSESGDDLHMFGSERVFFLEGFHAKKQALLMGLGYGWMPSYLIREELKRRSLVEVKYQGGSRYRFTPWLIHHRDRPLGRAGKALTRLIREHATR